MAEKILVVDDDKGLAEMLALQLKDQGYTVETAGDGYEALEKARAEKPDLIILDIMLPKVDGYEVCRLLKFDRRYENIPILMFTSLSGEEKEKIGLEVGADAYLSKPFVMEEVLAAVKNLLSQSKT